MSSSSFVPWLTEVTEVAVVGAAFKIQYAGHPCPSHSGTGGPGAWLFRCFFRETNLRRETPTGFGGRFLVIGGGNSFFLMFTPTIWGR